MNTTLLILLFAIGTFSHAGFLIFAKRSQARSEHFRLKLWRLHCVFNGVLWFVIIGLILATQFSFVHDLYSVPVRIFGSALVCSGILLVAKSYFLLGMKNAMGFRFFFPEKTRQIQSAIYRFLNNPMYDGFVLVLLGLGLSLGMKEDLSLALTSFLFLNILLAAVENYKFTLNPF